VDSGRRRFLRIAGFGVLLGAGGGTLRRLTHGIPAARAASPDFNQDDVQGGASRSLGPDSAGQKATAHGLTAGRWALIVDTRRCQEKTARDGCRDCIQACHAIHNVPAIPDPSHELKWLWKEPYANAFPDQRHSFVPEGIRSRLFPVLCNHCDNPPCVRVCPAKATFKRPDGIVAVDYHRCIGCRYCMAACPYGARSFNWGDPRLHLDPAKIKPGFPTRTRGVVEKCNFCEERLSAGMSPACVEACREGALIFGDLSNPESEPRKMLRLAYTIQRRPEIGTGPAVYYVL